MKYRKTFFLILLIGGATVTIMAKEDIRDNIKKIFVSIPYLKEEQLNIHENYEQVLTDELDVSKYLNLDTSKGLDLYVWTYSGEYYFGLLKGTNRAHTIEEKKELLNNPATLNQINEILNTYKDTYISILRLNENISDQELDEAKELLKNFFIK